MLTAPHLVLRRCSALRLRGKYMGTMRGLPAAKRAKVKKVRAEKGIREAWRGGGSSATREGGLRHEGVGTIPALQQPLRTN